MITLPACPRLTDNVSLCSDEYPPYIAYPSKGKVYLTNPVGIEIVRLCNGANDVETIMGQMSSRYVDVAPTTIQSDTRKFLEDLVSCGLLL
jgi:hypothetical protein